jgi:hypothetical protein
MKGAAAYAALVQAMEHTAPLCLGDDRFVQDQLEAADEIELRETCTLCPLRSVCDAAAKECRFRAGFWAGRQRH